MTPEKHPHQNTLCTPPAGWDDRGGELRLPALYAMRGTVLGAHVFLTRWRPTQEELMMLLAGGEVELACIGGQPSCNLSVIAPNEINGHKILLPN